MVRDWSASACLMARRSLQASDGLEATGAAPMDDGKRALLQAAVASMTEDVVKVIKQHMGTLVGDGAAADKCAALDALLEYLEDMDLARDFLAVGGAIPLIQCMAAMHCCAA